MAEDKNSPVYSKLILSRAWRLSGMQEHTAFSLRCPGLGICLLVERCNYLFQDMKRKDNDWAKGTYIPYGIQDMGLGSSHAWEDLNPHYQLYFQECTDTVIRKLWCSMVRENSSAVSLRKITVWLVGDTEHLC